MKPPRPMNLALPLAATTAAAMLTPAVSPILAAEYSESLPGFESFVRQEMEDWGIGGIAVALVDGDETVYVEGFGEAEADSVFRVGSVSKLFAALTVMQHVEAGVLDLDAPVDPALLPVNRFPDSPAVTLRQLHSHKSGLQREPGVGHYLDPSEPGLAATVASLQGGVLVTLPGDKTRYSNIGPSLAGWIAAEAAGTDFADLAQERILGPLGMRDSWWARDEVPESRLIAAHMRVALPATPGGWERWRAPVFDLGTQPAGNLFSTAGDLAKFASALLAGGGGVVSQKSLEEMWTPQLTDGDTGFGIGFAVGEFRGHRLVGHTGAVYGFSTAFAVLPDAGLAAVVLANEDIASGPVGAVREAALALLVETKLGESTGKQPADDDPPALAPEDLARCAGHYESQSYWAELAVVDGQLVGEISGQPTRFTPAPSEERLSFTVRSRIESGSRFAEFESAEGGGPAPGFAIGPQQFRRVGTAEPPPVPDAWSGLLGSYGHDFIPLVVTQRHGHLYVMTENMVDYRLTPVETNVFSLPAGMYIDEHAVFHTGADGMADRVQFASMLFDRQRDSVD